MEDEETEDVAVADGAMDFKVEEHPLSPELTYNVIIVVSMDITLDSVHEDQVVLGDVKLLKASTGEATSIQHEEGQREPEVNEDEVVKAVTM